MSIQTVEISLPESIIKIIEIRQGPAGTGGGGSNNITSATTSDGTANLYLDSIRFEATNGGPTQLGEMAWESTDGSIDAMLESGVIVAMGEDLVIRVRNTTASPITKGTALAYDGTSGASGRIDVKPWVGANIPTAKLFLGFAACDIPANSNGYSQWFGKLAEINTSGGAQTWLDEQIIYAVPGASATLTNIAPTSGEYAAAAVVINAGSGTSGILFVRPTFESITSLISLGAGTTGSELFGAATAAAARTTLMGEILKYDPNAAATRTNPATQANDDILTGINLTAGMWEFDFSFSFDAGACGVAPRFLFGTIASVDSIDARTVGGVYRADQALASLVFRTTTGTITPAGNGASTNVRYSGFWTMNIIGDTTLDMQFARNADSAGTTIIRRAGAFLRARRINA